MCKYLCVSVVNEHKDKTISRTFTDIFWTFLRISTTLISHVAKSNLNFSCQMIINLDIDTCDNNGDRIFSFRQYCHEQSLTRTQIIIRLIKADQCKRE